MLNSADEEGTANSYTREGFAGLKFGNYGTQNIEKYIDIGTCYYFNKNVSTFIDYKLHFMKTHDFTDATGLTTKDVVAAGLIYQF